MPAYVELRAKGGQMAYIEAGSVLGVVTAPGMTAYDVATEDKPVAIILRAGVTIEVVGESAGKILVRMALIRKQSRDEGRDVMVDFLGQGDGDVYDDAVQEPMG